MALHRIRNHLTSLLMPGEVTFHLGSCRQNGCE